jgi:hypothetical protein
MIKEMNITSVQYRNDDNGNPSSIKAQIDGKSLSVPLDPGNRHYAEIMQQVDAGELVVEPDPGPSEEQLAARARSQRDALLSQSDWTQVPDAPVDQSAWAGYRQTLRDIPQQAGFPTEITWPTKPNES